MKQLLSLISVICGSLIAVMVTIRLMLIPLQVETKPSPEQLKNACLTGYFAPIKQVNYMHVIDATIFCEEKYPQ